MSEERQILETKGIQVVYCNSATTSMSYHDIRLYIVDQSPSELALNPTGSELSQKPPLNEPKFCLVLTPEFAASLTKSLADTVAQYESVFGPLRPQPTQESILAALAKTKK